MKSTTRTFLVRLFLTVTAAVLFSTMLSPQPGLAQSSAAVPAGPLSDQPSPTIGTICPLPPDPGKPEWDGADRANDVAFFGNRYAVIVGYFQCYEKGGSSYPRQSLVIVDMTTGQPTAVSLPIKGEVFTVKISASGDAAYIGGNFDVNVGGEKRHNAAKIDLITGALYAWDPIVDKVVYDIDLAGKGRGKVLLAGSFTTLNGVSRPYFASVNNTSGALTDWVKLQVAGGQDGPTLGFNFVTNNDGTLMVGTGSFTSVNGKVHNRVFVLKATKGRARLVPWSTRYTNNPCGPSKDHEELGAVFSGKFKFGLAATGGDKEGSTCDAVSVWTLKEQLEEAKAKPLWINYTNQDSMSGVAFFRGYTYGAGHNKGCAIAAGRPYTVVDRPGLCEYNAKTGQLTSWNPTTSRQRSMHVRLVPTPATFQVHGLFYVGDANRIGGEERNNIAFFPVT